MNRQPKTRARLAICALLALAVLSIYLQTLDFDFINYDDPTYVTENAHVRAGLTADSVKWAFTTLAGSNWHPLTWISHMLDWQLYGNRPGLHHMTSVAIHLANTILLFLLLVRMTGSVWRSGFVAALFAVHPMHVESVAWISERKDVLSALFWILTMWAYVRYVESPSVKRYSVVLLAFPLGLMAKPMLVTLPFALLLLDFWPLQRLKGNLRPLLLEKAPLIFQSAAFCAVAYLAQQQGGAVAGLQTIPTGLRASNAIAGYVTYLERMFRPLHLAVFYPYPHDFPVWLTVGAALVLVVLTMVAIRQRRKRPYLTVGWLWYVGTLVPVIGLVQIGEQATADRYTYIPLIGLFMAIAWLAPAGIHGKEEANTRQRRYKSIPIRARKILPPVAAVAAVFALTLAARVQAGYWRDSETLFRHALDVTTGNYIAHNNLGVALAAEGKTDEAMAQYRQALEANPIDPDANYNLGTVLASRARYRDAIRHYRASLKIRPNSPKVLDNLGNALSRLGRFDEAIDCYRRSLVLNRDNAGAHNNLANALSRQGKYEEAISEYGNALCLDPDFGDAHKNLAVTLFQKGDYAGAWSEVQLARKYGARLNPGFLNALSWKMPEPAAKVAK